MLRPLRILQLEMNFNRLKALSRHQWWWFLQAYWKLLVVQLRIKFADMAWLANKLTAEAVRQQTNSIAKKSSPPKPDKQQAERMYEAVRLAARCQFLQTACLPRSIVLVDMLNTKLPRKCAVIKLGVNKKPGISQPFSSHAWVELNGQMIGEPEKVGKEYTKILEK